jgi:hypothetical protein
MIDRRSFLKRSTIATGALAFPAIISERSSAQTATPNPAIMAAASATHAQAIANVYAGTYGPTDWRKMTSSCNTLYTHFTSIGFDSYLQSSLDGVTSLSSNSFDLTPTLQQVRAYVSGIGLSDIQQCVNVLPSDAGSINNALIDLKHNGLTVKFLTAAKENAKIQVAMQNNQNANLRGETKPSLMEAVYRYNGGKPRLQPIMTMPSVINGDRGGGGGWSCQTDGAAIFFVGLAFAAIGILTMGVEPILVGAAWYGLATYGGLATAGWGMAMQSPVASEL